MTFSTERFAAGWFAAGSVGNVGNIGPEVAIAGMVGAIARARCLGFWVRGVFERAGAG